MKEERAQQTVLITGAAVRVGREIALALASDGWNVAIHYHKSKTQAEELAKLIRDKGRTAFTVQADLCNPEQVANIFPALAKQGASVDCLINNASVFEKDNLTGLTPESWKLHMDVNLFAPLQLTRDFAAQYSGSSGNVINLTDGLVGWSVSSGFLSYALSKSGLAEATRMLSRELAPRIRINAIALGPTLEGKQDKPDTYAKLRKIIPLARTSSPQEVCDTVRYILGAPSFTGQVISLAGGM
ncbi:MAG TPA: SDR family oxidoreductase [Rickettsiales bacterium]|nr:SDR family oxidoreductase [Rickettsiales bacterium]